MLDSVLLDPLPRHFFGSLRPSPIVFSDSILAPPHKIVGGVLVYSRRCLKYSRYSRHPLPLSIILEATGLQTRLS
jgi:hypothetical protein